MEQVKRLLSFQQKPKAMNFPPHLEKIRQNTKFTAKEILDFQKKFMSICPKNSSELSMENFVKFMRMMGVKSNATLIARIFNVMDFDKNGAINFTEFMQYFDILLKGTIKQKTEFCFLIITAGNLENYDRPIEKKKFVRDDLFQLLKIMRESELKNAISGELDEDEELKLQGICDNMMEMLKVEADEVVTLQKFRNAIDTDRSVLEAFQLIGQSLETLMSYQGQNKYTSIVNVLRLVKSKFSDLAKRMEGVNKTLERHSLIKPIPKNEPIRARRAKKMKTILEHLDEKVGDGSKTSSHPISRKISSRRGNKKSLPDLQAWKYESPNIQARTKKRMDILSVIKPSSINIDESKLAGSSILNNFFGKDESNIVINDQDGIGEDKLRSSVLKTGNFKIGNQKNAANRVDLNDLKKIINQIENGTFDPDDDKIIVLNKDYETKQINFSRRKSIPVFRTIRSSVKKSVLGNSRVFEEFEEFVRSQKDNILSTGERTKLPPSMKTKDFQISNILESKEYKECRFFYYLFYNFFHYLFFLF